MKELKDDSEGRASSLVERMDKELRREEEADLEKEGYLVSSPMDDDGIMDLDEYVWV